MLWGTPIAWGLMLPVVAACAFLAWRRRPAVAATRLLLGSLLVAVLADPSARTERDVERVVHIVDTSPSLPEIIQETMWAAVERDRAELDTHARLAVIQVDGAARLLHPLTDAIVPLPPPLPPSERAATALGEGLRQAGAILPHGSPGRVVVHTDGQVDPDRLGPQLDALARRGISVEVEAPAGR